MLQQKVEKSSFLVHKYNITLILFTSGTEAAFFNFCMCFQKTAGGGESFNAYKSVGVGHVTGVCA